MDDFQSSRKTLCICLLFCAVALAGCAAPPKETGPAPIKVADWQLTVSSNGPTCIVSATHTTGLAQRVDLKMKPPCAPVQDHRGTTLVHGYIDVGADVVVFIGDLKRGCGRTSRGVLVASRLVTLSPRVAHGPVKCVSAGMDEKEFWQFAHPS